MALEHALSCDLINVRLLGDQMAAQKTSAIFKLDQLELIRLVHLAGKSFPFHQVPGEITIQCIEGEIAVTVQGASNPLRAAEMMFLEGCAPQSEAAIKNSSALVTSVLCRTARTGSLRIGKARSHTTEQISFHQCHSGEGCLQRTLKRPQGR
jgi:hypothetical protein